MFRTGSYHLSVRILLIYRINKCIQCDVLTVRHTRYFHSLLLLILILFYQHQAVICKNTEYSYSVGVEIAAHNAGVGRRPSVQSAAPLAAMPRVIILRTAR